MNNDLVIVSKMEVGALLEALEIRAVSGDPWVVGIKAVKELLNKAQVVDGEPVAMVCFDGIGEQQATAIKWLTEYFPKKGDMLFTAPQPAIPEGFQDFDLKFTCIRIRRLLTACGLGDPSNGKDEVLMGCLFSLLGTICNKLSAAKKEGV